MPTKVKGKFFRIVIKPTMLYESDSWVVKVKHIYKKNFEEIQMLR